MLEYLERFFSRWESISGLCVFLALLVGIALRRNRKVHPPMMITCFLADVALVTYLELARGAVEKVTTHIEKHSMPPELSIHIAIASLSIVFYIMLIVTGYRVLKGKTTNSRRHRTFAIIFVIVRFASLVTAVIAAGAGAAADKGL